MISIYVPNIEEALDFYTNTLGFALSKRYGPKIASLVHGELPIVLEENDNAIYKDDLRITGVGIGIQTDDIYETVQFLKEKEVNFLVAEPADCPPGKYISITDPFGNIIDFLQYDKK